MAVIYLEHPKHGSKVACAEAEALADEKNGWVRRKVAALLQAAPVAPVAPVAENSPPVGNALAPAVDDLAELRQRWQEKFGSKPHHKKSAATLRAELAE